MSQTKPKLRSQQWFGTTDKNGFMYRSWMKNQGIPDHEFDGRPIIGICNTWSELTPCNAHFRKLAEHVKRGIYEAGGFPVEFPVFSNGESNLRPSAMLTRRPPGKEDGRLPVTAAGVSTAAAGMATATAAHVAAAARMRRRGVAARRRRVATRRAREAP